MSPKSIQFRILGTIGGVHSLLLVMFTISFLYQHHSNSIQVCRLAEIAAENQVNSEINKLDWAIMHGEHLLPKYLDSSSREIRLVSLNPIGTKGLPDEWETSALQSFRTSESKKFERVSIRGHMYFRFIKPLVVQESCLNCHDNQGLRCGGIHGGISINLDGHMYQASIRQNFFKMLFFHSLALVLINVFFYFGGRQLSQALKQKETTIDLLNDTQQNLKHALEKAEESDRLKSAFLANMSHEIRTPMNGILGFAELLKEPNIDKDEMEGYINIIEKSGYRMLTTINDLIEISKIEAGQVDVSSEEVIVEEILEEHYHFFKNAMTEKGIGFSMEVSNSNAPLVLLSDADKLAGILTNLIKNALKFTETGSVIFGYEIQGHDTVFFVKDTGVGIPTEYQQKVFDRFAQVEITRSKVHEGSGLGLAICKANVDLLGGEIWFESQEEQGSTFFFKIPVS